MRHAVREYEHEPMPGLPEVLPAGETILWRGQPTWWGIATTVCHIRAIAIYFAALIVWSVWAGLSDGRPIGAAIAGALRYLPLVGAIGLGLLAGIALLVARTTVYTITNRRVVIRFGMAMPMAVNLPFAKIERAAVHRGAAGSGDIALGTPAGDDISSLFLWPHVRPLRFMRPEPMLRSIPDVERVAGVLSEALVASASQPATVAVTAQAAASQPVRQTVPSSGLAAVLLAGVEARRKPRAAEPPSAATVS